MTVHSRRGFTLIELTIAVVLLAIGLLALTGAIARALHETSAARTRHAALREAEEVADSLAAVETIAAGALVAPGLVIEWQPVACPSVPCVRVTARTPADTIALLAAARGAAGP